VESLRFTAEYRDFVHPRSSLQRRKTNTQIRVLRRGKETYLKGKSRGIKGELPATGENGTGGRYVAPSSRKKKKLVRCRRSARWF